MRLVGYFREEVMWTLINKEQQKFNKYQYSNNTTVQ